MGSHEGVKCNSTTNVDIDIGRNNIGKVLLSTMLMTIHAQSISGLVLNNHNTSIVLQLDRICIAVQLLLGHSSRFRTKILVLKQERQFFEGAARCFREQEPDNDDFESDPTNIARNALVCVRGR